RSGRHVGRTCVEECRPLRGLGLAGAPHPGLTPRAKRVAPAPPAKSRADFGLAIRNPKSAIRNPIFHSATLVPMADDRVTLILSAIDAGTVGGVDAAGELLPLVYDQLRKAAQLQMAGERGDHTLSATALVH